MTKPPLKTSNAAEISRAACAWFTEHQRDLPFRKTTDPYAILVSELMLQQTQVATVIPYFARFLAKFATVHALASAPEVEVLAAWAGLGYYRRARLLHAAAKAVVEQHGGEFPRDLASILALPGIGRYTAGAVYSFAYDRPAPIVEANTARLYARLFAVEGDLRSGVVQARLWQIAEGLLPPKNARQHNYALMELGALVCKPVPLCEKCPLRKWCAAYQQNLQLVIPIPSPKPEKLQRAFAGIVLQAGEKYLVREIPEGEWHHGMFEFPAVAVEPGATRAEHLGALRQFLQPAGVKLENAENFAQFRYTVTRHAVLLEVYRGTIPARGKISAPFAWKTLEQISSLPLGSAQIKLLDLLKKNDELFAHDS